jgi:hypothetical protein
MLHDGKNREIQTGGNVHESYHHHLRHRAGLLLRGRQLSRLLPDRVKKPPENEKGVREIGRLFLSNRTNILSHLYHELFSHSPQEQHFLSRSLFPRGEP